MNPSRRSLAFFLAAFATLSVLVNGFEMLPLKPAELAKQADLIVRGRVLNKTVLKDSAGRIYTSIHLQVSEVWKGTPPSNPLVVVHGGGTLGTENSAVAGQVEYTNGEDVLCFLVLNERKEAVTIGLSQGKFHLWHEEGSAETLAHNVFFGRGPASNAALRAASLVSDSGNLTLKDLKNSITSTLVK